MTEKTFPRYSELPRLLRKAHRSYRRSLITSEEFTRIVVDALELLRWHDIHVARLEKARTDLVQAESSLDLNEALLFVKGVGPC